MGTIQSDEPILSKTQVWLIALGIVLWLGSSNAGLLFFASDSLFLACWCAAVLGFGLTATCVLFGVVRAEPRQLRRPTAWAASFRRAGLPWQVLVSVAVILVVAMGPLMMLSLTGVTSQGA